jgi:CDP-diacylglycerol--glycerol-3-phosphate 3-phosphatidyltransferase
VGLGAPQALLTVVLALLALASAVTVVQRVLTVRRQALHLASNGT